MFSTIGIRETFGPGFFTNNLVNLTPFAESVEISYDELSGTAEVSVFLSKKATPTLINQVVAGSRPRDAVYSVLQNLEIVHGGKILRAEILDLKLTSTITAYKEYSAELKFLCRAPFIRYDSNALINAQSIESDGTNLPYAFTPRISAPSPAGFSWVIFPSSGTISDHLITTESTGASGSTTRTFNCDSVPGKSYVLLLTLYGYGTTATITVNNYVTRQFDLNYDANYATFEVFRFTPTYYQTSNTFNISWSTNPPYSSFKIVAAFCFEARDYVAASASITGTNWSYELAQAETIWRSAITAGGGRIFKPKHRMSQVVVPSISGLTYQWRYAEYL